VTSSNAKGPAVRKILLSAALFPSLALASGYSLPNTNPRDLGLCASSVAAQRDSGAAFALPAALARLEGPSVRVGLGGVDVMSTWTDPAPTPTPLSSNATEVDMDKFTPFGSLSAAYGGRLAALGNRGWGVGIGIQPFGGAIVDWPGDWPGRYRIEDVDRRSFSGVLTAGIELLPSIRIGGGLVYYYTTQEFTQYQFLPSPPLPSPAVAKATLDQNGGALSFDVSLEVDPIPNVPFRIGIDYKHQAVQDLDGDVTWEGLPPGASALNPLLANQDVEETLTIPNLLNVGLAYRVMQPLLVTFTYTFDRWEVYETDTFIGDVPGAVLTLPRNYGNGHTFRAGAEYDVTPALQVRVGLQRDISNLDERFYSPTLPDGSSWGGSLGATYRFGKNLSVDAGLFYANMDEVEAENAAASEPTTSPLAFRGTYEPSALVYGVSLGWAPGAR
jgi:long-chain fatty acid transport protein